MWFKTRIGLACIEGTAEFMAGRWTRPGVGKCVGVYAYQMRQPEVTQKRLFQKATTNYSRGIYLACMPDDGGDDEVVECMRRIETAVRSGAPICDLSDIGTATAWAPPEHGVMIHWQGHDPLADRYR
jgi:hypothetical protein